MKSKTQALSREAALIAALHERFGPAPPEVILGIGDDCAAISLDGADYLLWTMDTLVEGSTSIFLHPLRSWAGRPWR
jgi:thiamine monophosphate kinase